jgi:hypothetical protein
VIVGQDLQRLLNGERVRVVAIDGMTQRVLDLPVEPRRQSVALDLSEGMLNIPVVPGRPCA